MRWKRVQTDGRSDVVELKVGWRREKGRREKEEVRKKPAATGKNSPQRARMPRNSGREKILRLSQLSRVPIFYFCSGSN